MKKFALLTGGVLVCVGMCFGAAFFHWNCSRLKNCDAPWGFLDAAPAASSQATGGGAVPAVPAAAGARGDEEHLLKLQETVLHEIESSNTKTKEMLDFALLVVGFVGSLVLAIFGYFGWSTAKELREQKSKAEAGIKALNARQEEAASALAKFDSAQHTISNNISKETAPKLGQIANYGMKIAEFAGSQWEKMSFEDRIRNCDEAFAALEAADLGEEAFAPLSFIRARQGLALLAAGDYLKAAAVLEEASRYNVRKKPDRPYNVACAFSRLAEFPAAVSKEMYTAKAVDQLKLCLELGTNDPVGSTISRAYFLKKIRDENEATRDKDLDPIRGSDAFKAFLAAQ
jgi:hypothetical protein